MKDRIIVGGLCILAIVAALLPVIIILILQKYDSVDKVATVNAVVTIKNMDYSNELADKDSKEFTNLSVLFCDEIKTAFTTSDLKDSYNGCVVHKLRNGSITVEFLVIFVSREIPSRESIVPILSIEILGAFTFKNSSLTIGEIKQIEAADNPSPKIAYGGNCRVNSSCKTRQAHCIDQQCTCRNPKFIDKSSDSCILSDGQVRLVNGTQRSGRIEILYQGIWGTICDGSWNNNNAKVVCRMLGYRGGIAYGEAHFGQGSGRITLDGVHCTGSESTITACSHWPWLSHLCGHHEDAGVSCT